ncbi:MAG: hypothetical protein D6731_20000 [Planctomycetota bacterium]|nr:MAG: hypothetical protein D6731_20000 [Planctomycetota bacterium]
MPDYTAGSVVDPSSPHDDRIGPGLLPALLRRAREAAERARAAAQRSGATSDPNAREEALALAEAAAAACRRARAHLAARSRPRSGVRSRSAAEGSEGRGRALLAELGGERRRAAEERAAAQAELGRAEEAAGAAEAELFAAERALRFARSAWEEARAAARLRGPAVDPVEALERATARLVALAELCTLQAEVRRTAEAARDAEEVEEAARDELERARARGEAPGERAAALLAARQELLRSRALSSELHARWHELSLRLGWNAAEALPPPEAPTAPERLAALRAEVAAERERLAQALAAEREAASALAEAAAALLDAQASQRRADGALREARARFERLEERLFVHGRWEARLRAASEGPDPFLGPGTPREGLPPDPSAELSRAEAALGEAWALLLADAPRLRWAENAAAEGAEDPSTDEVPSERP